MSCSRSAICRDYSYDVIKRITAIKTPLKFPNTIFIGDALMVACQTPAK